MLPALIRISSFFSGLSASELARALGLAALGDEGVDLRDRHRRPFILGTAQRQHAQHEIALVETAANQRGIGLPHFTGIHRRVHIAHELEARGILLEDGAAGTRWKRR